MLNIVTYRMSEKNLEINNISDIIGRTYKDRNKVLNNYLEQNREGYTLFIIHPERHNQITKVIKQTEIDNCTVMIVSETPEDYLKYKSNNIHVVSYGIETTKNQDKKIEENFKKFYDKVTKLTDNYNENIIELLKIYIDPDIEETINEQETALELLKIAQKHSEENK